MRTHNAILFQLVLCALSLLVSVALSVAGMKYGSAQKSRALRNAEWGLTAFVMATALLTLKWLVEVAQDESLCPKIDLWTVWIRTLFVWVPYNFYRHVRNLKKEEKHAL